MLFYSHIWDGLLKLITLIGFIVLATSLKFDERLHSGPVMVGLVAIVWILIYRQFFSILSSWLYARLSLRTDVSFREAKALRRLFQLDLSGKWIPAKEIKGLPFDTRHAALLHLLDNFSSARQAMLL